MYESLSSSTWVNCWARTVADGHSSVMSTWKTRLTVPFVFECGRKAVAMKSSASGALPPFNVEYCERWKASPIHSTEFTKTKSGNGRKPHTSPSFPFQFSSCRRLGQIQPSSYLRRGFQVVSGRPTPRRSQPLDKDPLGVSWTAVVSKRLCQRFEGRGNDFEGCFDAERWPSLYRCFIVGFDIWRWFMDGGVLIWVSW